MYKNSRNEVIINCSFNDDFLVQVGLLQGSVLGPVLYVIALEILSMELRYACSESCFMSIIWD